MNNPTQIIEWFCTQGTYWQFKELIEMLGELHEDSDEFQAIVEEIKSLPNFPHNYSSEHAHIFPVVTDVQVSGKPN